MDNKDIELFDGIIDVPNNTLQNNNGLNTNQNNFEYNFSFEMQDTQAKNNSIEPEILSFDDEHGSEQLNEQGKPINRELLKNLSEDTNNLVNPDMVINPLGKKKEQDSNINVDEPKVNYEEINNKRNYALMTIIFLVIIVFIIFLPKIISVLGI